MSIPKSSTKKKWFKWYHLYYFLAAFDVLTISASLYLNHSVLGIYSDSVDVNSVWSNRVSQYSRLNELAASVNAPGNDAFDSGDIVGESHRLTEAYQTFQKATTTARDDLKTNTTKEISYELLDQLNLIDEQVAFIHEEASAVFVELKNHRQDSAGSRMAEMDRCFSRSLGLIGELCQEVRKIQSTRFNVETARAQWFSQFEIAIAGIVCLILCVVTWYGHKMANFMRRSEMLSENYTGQLQAINKSQMVIEFELDGTIIKANDLFLQAMGYSKKEVIGQHHSMFVEPELRESDEYRMFWEKLNRGEFVSAELKRLGNNGKEVWIQASYNPILDLNGKPCKVVKYSVDVTQQKLLSTNFECQLEAINKSQMVIEFELDGTIIKANDLFLQAMGYSKKEVIGQHHSMFVEPELRESDEYRMFWEKLNRGEFVSAELKRLGNNGKEVWIQASYNPILDLNGKPCKVVKYSVDVTQQKLLNTEISNAKNSIEAIVNTATDPIITITGRGLINSFNPAAEQLFGYSEGEVLEENVKMLMPSPYREEHDGYLERYLTTGKQTVIGVGREVIGLRKDGTTFPLHLSVSQVVVKDKDKDKDVLFTGIIRDLTEQKQQESKLVQAKRDAEVANQSKSDFLANMSHEIRTPMTAILGFTDILLDNVVKPENIDAVRTVKENGSYLINLINDILDLSKIEAGKIDIEQINCSTHEIVADVASLMRVRATAKGLPLDVRFEGPIPKTIQSDPTRLRQVLINLVGNAIKFTETGSVQIVTRLLNETGDDPKLQFDVIDTGIGIAEGGAEKLFLAFTQADNSTTRQFGGTGLGLTISKRLAEALGGDISVRSSIGKGSTFSISISTGPLEDGQLIHKSVEAFTESVDVIEASTEESPLATRRILLTEDGPDNQRLIGFLLKKAGAEVTLADNGQIGLELATIAKSEGRPFDVILMDMQMPVLDGYSATRQLRENGYTLPIIAMTAHAMSSDRQKCLDAGCDDYTTKPIDRNKLISLVASYAKRSEVVEATSTMY